MPRALTPVPYEFFFQDRDSLKTHKWIRYRVGMERVLESAKEAAQREYANVGGFLIRPLHP